jgi:hypothetical protein
MDIQVIEAIENPAKSIRHYGNQKIMNKDHRIIKDNTIQASKTSQTPRTILTEITKNTTIQRCGAELQGAETFGWSRNELSAPAPGSGSGAGDIYLFLTIQMQTNIPINYHIGRY